MVYIFRCTFARPDPGYKSTILLHIVRKVHRVSRHSSIKIGEKYYQHRVQNMIHRPSAKIANNILHKSTGYHPAQCCGKRYHRYSKDYWNHSSLIHPKRKMCHLTTIHSSAHNSFGILNRDLPLSKCYKDYAHNYGHYHNQEDKQPCQVKSALGL